MPFASQLLWLNFRRFKSCNTQNRRGTLFPLFSAIKMCIQFTVKNKQQGSHFLQFISHKSILADHNSRRPEQTPLLHYSPEHGLNFHHVIQNVCRSDYNTYLVELLLRFLAQVLGHGNRTKSISEFRIVWCMINEAVAAGGVWLSLDVKRRTFLICSKWLGLHLNLIKLTLNFLKISLQVLLRFNNLD